MLRLKRVTRTHHYVAMLQIIFDALYSASIKVRTHPMLQSDVANQVVSKVPCRGAGCLCVFAITG